jgi:hypothetical protein
MPKPNEEDAGVEGGDGQGAELSLVTADEFAAVALEAPIGGDKRVDAHALRDGYEAAFNAAIETGQAGHARVFRILGQILGIGLHPDDPASVWVPMFSGPGGSTAIPGRFAGDQSRIFADVAGGVTNPGLKARLADVAWTNDRTMGACGASAAEAYAQCAEGLIDRRFEPWRGEESRRVREAAFNLQRALQIVALTSKKTKRPAWVVPLVRKVYEAARDAKELRDFHKVALLGLKYGYLSDETVASETETLASVTATQFPDEVAELWRLAAWLHEKAADQAARQRCLLNAAEQTLRMREHVGDSAAAQAHWITQAILELRHVPGSETRQAELEAELRPLQEATLSQMGRFEIDLRVEDEETRIRALFEKASFSEAMSRLAAITRSPDPKELRAEALKGVKQSPLMAMMGNTLIDGRGRPMTRAPGASLGEAPDQAWFDQQIHRNDGVRRGMAVVNAIGPAISVINFRFSIDQRHVAPIVSHSNFVPESQKPLMTLGLTRFLQGDMMSAVHLVVPQLEPCLRHVLKLNGHDAAKRRDDTTEEDLSLSGIYGRFKDQLVEILGADIADELDRLFNRRPGPALRHELAHGQISAGECFQHDVHYALWLIYRVCCLFTGPAWSAAVTPALDAAA